MNSLFLTLFGQFKAEANGSSLPGFRTRKVQALLIYLAAEPKTHRRESLMTLLWPGMPERSARQNLRQAIYNLRQSFPKVAAKAGEGDVGNGRTAAPLLLTNRQTIQLNPQADVCVDISLFENFLLQGQVHNHVDLLSCHTCRQSLEDAVALYTGDFLADFYLEDSNQFEDWAASRRQIYHRKTLDALETVTAIYARQKDFPQAHAFAERQLEIDDLRESTYRQLMEILALNGRRREALTQYETLAQLLQTELAVAPSAETQKLYETIRSDNFDNLVDSLPPPPPSTQPTTHNLPTQPTPFIGREAELADLARLLAEPETRLITILGAGGMGKTRLALAAAEADLAHYEDGVYYVSLASLERVKMIVPAIAHALNFSFYQGSAPLEQLLNYLGQKRMLLVIDNFEHLLDGAGIVAKILQNAPGVKLLATSRTKLGVQGEYLFRISGMAFPEDTPGADSERLKEAGEYSAVKLFVQSARRARPDFEPDAADWQAITRICRLTEGMPLGILLAAAWMEMLSPQEIADEIGRSLKFLETDAQDVPGRHRSMRALFDSSWNFMTAGEQQLFAALSIFRGGFTRPAAQEITGASLRELMTLVHKSLVRRHGNGRFTIHELLRQFSAKKLNRSPVKQEAVGQRHAVYYCQMLHKRAPELKRANNERVLAEIEDDIENFQAAWNWAVKQEQYSLIHQADFSLARFFFLTSHFEIGLTLFDFAAKRLAQHIALTGRVDPEEMLLQARLLTWQCPFLYKLGFTETAEQRGLEALSVLESAELQERDVGYERALVLYYLGVIYSWKDLPEATFYLEESKALFSDLDERWGLAEAIIALGSVALRHAEYKMAVEHFTEALHEYEALGDRREIVSRQFWISSVQSWLGHLSAGERHIRQSLTSFKEMGMREMEGWAYEHLGMVAAMQGQYEEACLVYAKSITLYNTLGMKYRLARSNSEWSWAAMLQGEYEMAQTRLRTSLHNFRANESKLGLGHVFFVEGSISLAQGNWLAAQRQLHKSANFLRSANQRDELSWSLAVWSCTLTKNDDPAQAKKILSEALHLAQEVRSFVSILYSFSAAALFLANRGQAVQAMEIYACVNGYPFVANSRWFDDVIGRPLRETAVTLPPDVLEAAKVRGREIDLWDSANGLLNELSNQR